MFLVYGRLVFPSIHDFSTLSPFKITWIKSHDVPLCNQVVFPIVSPLIQTESNIFSLSFLIL